MQDPASRYLALVRRRRVERRSAVIAASVILATGCLPLGEAAARNSGFLRFVGAMMAQAAPAPLLHLAVTDTRPAGEADQVDRIEPAAAATFATDAELAAPESSWSRCKSYSTRTAKACAIPLSSRQATLARAEVRWLTPYNVEVEFLTEGVEFYQSQRLGGEVIALQRHVYGSSLDAARSWRRELDAAVAVHKGDAVNAELVFGAFETQRPVIFARGGLGADHLARWRQNAVADAAARISMFEDRAEFTSGVAASETSLRRNVEAEPWLWLFEDQSIDRTDRGEAMFASLSATPLARHGVKAEFAANYTRADVDFRNFQTHTVGDIFYEGETFNLDADLALGKTMISALVERHDDPIYGFDNTRFKASRGPFSVKTAFGSESARFDDIVYFDDRRFSGEVAADFRKLLSIKDGDAPYAPDEVRVGFFERRGAHDSIAGGGARRSLGAGATFEGDWRHTDIYVFWNERRDPSFFTDFAASSEFGADVSQSFFGDGWSVSLYASMSDAKRSRRFIDDGAERIFSAGASASKKFRYFPTARVSFDAFTRNSNRIYSEETFQNHDLSVKGEIELSEMLFTGRRHIIVGDRPLSLYAAIYHGWGVTETSPLFRQSDRDTRFLMMLRKRL